MASKVFLSGGTGFRFGTGPPYSIPDISVAASGSENRTARAGVDFEDFKLDFSEDLFDGRFQSDITDKLLDCGVVKGEVSTKELELLD